MRVERVLLVCTGNTCRSPMAAALLQKLWEQASPGWALTVSSAGTSAWAGEGATAHAIEAMRRSGLDLSGHQSRPVTEEAVAGADLILTMTGRHRDQILLFWPDLADKIFTLAGYAGSGQDVPDPFGGTQADYEQTAAMMEVLLRAVVERIRREGTGSE